MPPIVSAIVRLEPGKWARPESRNRSSACVVLSSRASRVSSHAARTTLSEIEISSIRLSIRADDLYARR